MEQSSIPSKKRKSVRRLVPRKHIIDNILNYSLSLCSVGGSLLVVNN
ncbi:MAG: hypothetical protein K6A95_05745 [Bacteroidales bacterium]|nr:hypothetical protein [Bacteroidales bacterium]